MNRYTPCWLLLGVLVFGCRTQPPQARLPTEQEAGAEKTVVDYGPRLLHAFPTAPLGALPAAPSSGYLLLASERPGLPAVFRALAVTAQRPPAGYVARAGSLVWAVDHVVEAAAPPAAAGSAAATTAAHFAVYDRDGKVGTPVEVTLPAACTAAQPPLLQSEADRIYALLRCQTEQRIILLTLDAEARLLSARVREGVLSPELFLHQLDADYVLAGRQVLRIGSDASGQGSATIGTVPPPGPDSDAETRELVRAGGLLLVIDGPAGRVIGMDAQHMGWRFEKRFFAGEGGRVTRLRAALGAPDRLYIVTAEMTSNRAQHEQKLFATVLSLASGAQEPVALMPRLLLGSELQPVSDHELVPVAAGDGGGALLLYSHRGNSGPLVALRRLSL